MRINFWVLLLVIFSLYFLYLIREDILQYNELEKERVSFSLKTEKTIKENEALSATLKKLSQNSGVLVERLARERLNFIKKGELAYKVCQ